MTNRTLMLAAGLLNCFLISRVNGQVPEPPPGPKPPQRGQVRPNPEEGPKEVADWERTRRWPYGDSIPSERYIAARKRIQGMKKFAPPGRLAKSASQRAAADSGGWEELGPGNVGGRTRAMVIRPDDPNTMYAAGVSGGIWKTTDGGKNWRALTDMLTNIEVSTLAMDPNDPQTIYAGTGEYWANVARGAGVFKTTDGGDTWNYLDGTSSNSFYYTNKLWVSPADSNRVYAATWAGVMSSLDGGTTWALILKNFGPNLGCSDLIGRKDGGGSDILIASCMGPFNTPTATIYRTLTGETGGGWENVLSIPEMYRMSLAAAPSNQDVVYLLGAYGYGPNTPANRQGGFQALYRSAAGGAKDSWELRASGTDGNRINAALLSNPISYFADICLIGGQSSWKNQGYWDNAIAVDPANQDRVWVGGIDLFRSDDGGNTFGIASFWWASSSTPAFAHADQHMLLFHPKYNGTTNTTMFVTNDGGIFRSDNALASLATGARAACLTTGSQIKFSRLNNNYAVTQFNNGTVYPGGHGYFGGTQDNGTPAGLDTLGAQQWFSVLGGDGGASALNPQDVNVVYASVQRNSTGTWLSRSDDNGYHFAPAMSGIAGPFTSTNFLFYSPTVVDPNKPDRLYLGGKILWRTENKGVKWTAASAPIPNGLISAIAVHPADPNRVLVGTDQGWIHFSNAAVSANDSTAWDRTKPRFGYVSSISFDPRDLNTAYAVYSTFNNASDVGHVFMTTDGGATWNSIDGMGDNALPDIPVQSFAVNPRDSTTLYAGTDMGLFVSSDAGANWSFDASLPAAPLYALQWADNNGPVLFAFTYGRGAFRQRMTADPACTYTITGPAQIPAFGGALTNQLATGANCPWSFISLSGSFLTMPVSVGRGPGKLTLSTPINESMNARTATFQIATLTQKATQAAPDFPIGQIGASGAVLIKAIPYVGVQDTRKLLANPDNPTHSCTQSKDAKSMWFQYTPTSAAKVTISAKGLRDDIASGYGVVVAAYTKTALGDADTELACVAQAAASPAAYATVTVTPTVGQPLLIQVSGRATDNPGGFTIVVVN